MTPWTYIEKNITKPQNYLILCNLFLLCYSTSASAETLRDGVWRGTYSVSQYLAEYHINNINVNGKIKPNIKMILPELGSGSDFTYEVKDVLISETSLTFTIHKKKEIQKCILTRNGSEQYTGTCQSDADMNGDMLVEISMMPPPAEVTETTGTPNQVKNNQQ